MARGFENTQDEYTAEERDDNLEAKRLERAVKMTLPYGRALDDADFLLLLQEGFGGNRGAVLRRRLLAHCFKHYHGSVVLNEREREELLKYMRGEIRGRDGKPFLHTNIPVAPVEPWGEIPIPWEE